MQQLRRFFLYGYVSSDYISACQFNSAFLSFVTVNTVTIWIFFLLFETFFIILPITLRRTANMPNVIWTIKLFCVVNVITTMFQLIQFTHFFRGLSFSFFMNYKKIPLFSLMKLFINYIYILQ